MTGNSRHETDIEITAANEIPPLLVLGVGNVLLKDEGVGCHVARKLQQGALPPGVEIIDGGTMGMELLWHLEGREKVILIDVVQAEEVPGTVFRFKPDDIHPASGPKSLSFHQLGFFDMLKLAQYNGMQLPEIVIIGIQPKDISIGDTLTPEIEAEIPRIIQKVKEELKNRIQSK